MTYPGADVPPPNLPLRIGSVVSPGYVQVPVQSKNPHTGEPQPASLETYSGTIILNLSENNGTTNRFHCIVLVPMADTTIRSYGVEDNQPTSPFQIATCVSLAATSPNGEHVAINAIDQSSAGLIPQIFGGVDKSQNALILEFNIGYRWTTLIRVAYTITILSTLTGPEPPQIPQLDPNTLPDV
jgi:hypothetical protein